MFLKRSAYVLNEQSHISHLSRILTFPGENPVHFGCVLVTLFGNICIAMMLSFLRALIFSFYLLSFI